jgi:hypothetical protein
MFMSHEQNAGQNHNIKTANKSFENMALQIFGNDNKEKKIACMKKFKVD